MDSDWTVACAADDPVVVVPWESADRSLRFTDLRSNPQAIDELGEARSFPAIAAALRRWNNANGGVFTIKCDVWNYPARLFDAFDLSGFAHAHSSYIDLAPTDQTGFENFPSCEKLLRKESAASRAIDAPNARCEWVLRPALMCEANQNDPVHGFAISLYVWGYGESIEQAEATWSCALLALVEPVACAIELP